HSSSAATQGDRIILMILRPWRVAYAMLLPTPSLCRGACRMANHVNASIVKYFQTLEDPRIERTKKHQLLDLLVIAVCTLLTGGKGDSKTWNSLARASRHGSKRSSPCRMAFPRMIPLGGCLLVSIPSDFRSAFCPGPRRSPTSPTVRLSRWMARP